MIFGAFRGWPGSKGKIVGRMAIVQRRLVGRIVTGKDLIVASLIRGRREAEGGKKVGGELCRPPIYIYIYLFFLYD